MPTYEELKVRFPFASETFLRANTSNAPRQVRGNSKHISSANTTVDATLSLPVTESLSGGALVSHPQVKSGVPVRPKRRPRVEFTLYRVGLLDPDNKFSSVKFLLDALRQAKLIPNDRECDIELIVTQQKVGSYAQEGTGVEINYPKS